MIDKYTAIDYVERLESLFLRDQCCECEEDIDVSLSDGVCHVSLKTIYTQMIYESLKEFTEILKTADYFRIERIDDNYTVFHISWNISVLT